ncbi:MAG: zinc ribbon domain-containing protein [Nitrososphaerota archaeon]|jgi:beta-lactamase class A|nr:zinc ribbon domain-containing protein [Nitrososphaerota archaeon]MDG6929666.1 zinc ribbon domain-containing protein [Nitrososphaerota archaeon]
MVKYCPQCGTQNEDNAKFCEKCGYEFKSLAPNTPQGASSQTAPSKSTPTTAQSIPVNSYTQTQKKSKSRSKLVGGIILVFIGIIITGIGAVDYMNLQSLSNSYSGQLATAFSPSLASQIGTYLGIYATVAFFGLILVIIGIILLVKR